MSPVTGSVPLDVLLFLYAVVAPGVAIAWVSLSDPDPVVLVGVGLTIGVFCLPVLDFTLAMLLRTHINPPLLLGVGTAVLVCSAGLHRWRSRRAEAGG